jgi:endoglucanase Acf2
MTALRPFLAVVCACALAAAGEVVPTGAGSYLRGLPDGAKGPPVTPFVVEGLTGPVPTNTWWSSLAWLPLSETMFPHPFSVKATKDGLALNYPGAHLGANKHAIVGMGGHDLVLGHSAVATFTEARVAGWSDFFVTTRMGEAGRGMTLTFGHGSPYVYADYAGGEPVVIFKSPPTIVVGDGKSEVLVVKVATRIYGLYAPSGSTWSGLGSARLTAQTRGKTYCAVAVLPDEKPSTLEQFQACAYNHVTGSQATWTYDQKSAKVSTRYAFRTVAKQGPDTGTLFALYPHQWRDARADFTGQSYGSVRGPMKLAKGSSFESSALLPPLLPALPVVASVDRAQLKQHLAADLAGTPQLTGDTYWLGKQLGKWATLLPIAEQLGEKDAAAECERRLKTALENFLTVRALDGREKKSSIFAYEPNWGTLIGYPASFGSDQELNDHHFHYGYFLHAAAELARRDPAWSQKWLPMIRLLARDIASADRRDPLFPYLRCFDIYAGHSWASGHGRFGDGNNQESSSESINAWYGLLMLAEVTGDKELRDQAAWLLATEVSAIEDYWFDVHGDLFPRSYPASVVTMVWGGKGANATWFDANPQSIHGINFLPVTAGSLYLGRFPAYARKNYTALLSELAEFRVTAKKGVAAQAPLDHWADVLWMQQATFDATGAKANWAKRPANFKPEPGNSFTQTELWLQVFEAFGTIDASVTADTPFAAVFTKKGKRSYVAWNLTAKPVTVTFSDRTVLICPTKEISYK